jgi:hypothetical protein
VGDGLRGPGLGHPVGNALPLAEIPLGTTVHNIELRPGKGGQMARSAGAGVQVVAKEGDFVTLRMPSTEMRMVRRECMATVGQIGNVDHSKQSIGKAGANRWRGRRPEGSRRGMNPIDHPHGGGEGKTSGGRHPVSPWGKEGVKTRERKKARTSSSSAAASGARRRSRRGRFVQFVRLSVRIGSSTSIRIDALEQPDGKTNGQTEQPVQSVQSSASTTGHHVDLASGSSRGPTKSEKRMPRSLKKGPYIEESSPQEDRDDERARGEARGQDLGAQLHDHS